MLGKMEDDLVLKAAGDKRTEHVREPVTMAGREQRMTWV
jgi:hypothetical protein